MAAMEGVVQDQSQSQQQQTQPPKVVERLNTAVQQQLNLESVKTRAISLFKAISRILEEFDVFARTNSVPKWQDVLGQFSMVNLELFNIVEDIKKVSKAFVVHPKNVNAENSTILPVMLSTKLLPEIEMDDNSKREQLLHGMQNLPISSQIDKLKTRIDMIGAACESAEKILAETRKAYSFGNRQGPTIVPIDKVQAAKIQEQENLLRAAVNFGEGLRIPGDQRQITPALPMHLVDVLNVGDGMQSFSEASGVYVKNTPPLSSNHINNQGALLQNQLSQLHDLQGQAQQKFQSLHGQHQIQVSQTLGLPQFPGRQLSSGHVQHGIGQGQLNQGSQLNRHLSQFSGSANSALFTGAQTTPNTQMIPNMSATMQSQSHLPRMQYMSGTNSQRSHASQILSDQMFNMGANTGGMMPMQQQLQQQQQQQLGSQGAFGNMAQNAQNLQPGMVALQNAPQNHPNFQQQRQQNQQ
ncbi:mediator of RNA polymerase II transcription subunit 8 isoform X2 [Malania oleifera]|uniref:mediator of RNA polymerase II transcription subunit 8 isoform X2 n=1 Tax=Malania oleifera TaxID=397392 RepID=UPI0025AE7C45|nr:mediator of RNA polymerase II transcription subunit 8 isoform X2 [Malania oleifera]